MKEHPIIFQADGVRAILDGRKTQTRRVMKEPAEPPIEDGWYMTGEIGGGFEIFHKNVSGGHVVWSPPRCPYGVPGDRLWVRECFVLYDDSTTRLDRDAVWYDRANMVGRHYAAGHYAADGSHKLLLTHPRLDKEDRDKGADALSWRPSIHMPRWASRLTLELIGVRVERVQDISRDDALSEGVSGGCGPGYDFALSEFKSLWDSINAKRGYGWAADPWVWALTFRKAEEKP